MKLLKLSTQGGYVPLLLLLLGYCHLGVDLVFFLLNNGFWHLLLLCWRDHYPPWCDGTFGAPRSLFREGLICSALRMPAPCSFSAVWFRQAPAPHATLLLSLVFILSASARDPALLILLQLWHGHGEQHWGILCPQELLVCWFLAWP